MKPVAIEIGSGVNAAPTVEGWSWQTELGQWAWNVTRDGELLSAGVGYDTKDAADDDMYEAFFAEVE